MSRLAKFRACVFSLCICVILVLGLAPRSDAPRVRVLLSPSHTTVNLAGAYRVSFIIEEDGVAAGGGVKARFVKGFIKPQTSNPNFPGFVSAHVSNPAASVAITQILSDDPAMAWPVDRNAWVVTAIVGSQALVRGDTIHITYGANPSGLMPGLTAAFTDTVLVACDLDGSGEYHEVSPAPLLSILPGAPRWLGIYAPSRVQIGVQANLKIASLDVQGNIAASFAGEVKVSSTDSLAELPPLLFFSPEDRGHKIIAIRFHSPGIHEIRAAAIGTSWNEMVSNPVEVTAEKPEYQLYWGDLHSHSSFSFDGYGREPFAAARDAAGLDFYALTEHTSYGPENSASLTAAEWDYVKQEVVRYNSPGQFVTIPGVEFSAAPPSGHHNIYFNAHDALVPQLPLLGQDVYGQIQEVWADKDRVLPPGVAMLTIPHHTGIVWGPGPGNDALHSAVSFGPGFSDSKLRPLIELFSQHGLSEAYVPNHPLSYKSLHPDEQRDLRNGPHFAQDAWALGEELGVIASSDDHTSRPGRDNVGIVAVYARELTRDAVFEALKSRRTYATTGKRLLLHFDVNGSLMGSKVVLPVQQYPRLTLRVAGTHELDSVEILRWENRLGLYQNGHPVFTSLLKVEVNGRNFKQELIDSTYAGASIYYVRVKQQAHLGNRESWAWSSPVWVYPEGDANVDEHSNLPRRLALAPGHPNPFKHEVSSRYYMSQPGQVKGVLYNALGQQVRVLFDEAHLEGWHDFRISGRNLPQGVYFMRLETQGEMVVQKILLVR